MTRKDNEELYGSLLRISSAHADVLSAINARLMDAMGGAVVSGFSNALLLDGSAVPELGSDMAGVNAAIQHFANQLKDTVPSISAPVSKEFAETLAGLQLPTGLAETMRELHLSTATLLTQMPQTQLVADLSDCFERARYDLMPSVFSNAVTADVIAASDMALMRLSGLVPVMGRDIAFPRGLKTLLNAISKSTAADLSRESSIHYRTEDGNFYHGSASVDPKALNVISAGRATIVDDDEKELFTEEELIDFVSYLATTPMMGLASDVGGRIKVWIERLFKDGDNTVGLGKEEYYHCRKRKSVDMPYTWEEMKKAPHGLPWTGRYNPAGSAHFYFADTRKGAENEVRRHLSEEEVLQTARIVPCNDIAMLDLSHTLSRGKSFLRMVRFPLSEASKVSKFPREYLLPCFVAECCKLIGFDGIKYYGSKEHANYVSWDDSYFECVGMC